MRLQGVELVRQSGEAIGRLVTEWVAAARLEHLAGRVETDVTVDGVRLDGVTVAHEHQLDDRLER